MRIDSLIYRLAYRGGTPPWDTGQPHPELDSMIDVRATGRALDLGCGSGANAVELARRGWDVVGVDFVAAAIEAADRRAREAGVAARFVNGDVSALRDCGIIGPFDLVIDVGCYHSIPVGIRDEYVARGRGAHASRRRPAVGRRRTRAARVATDARRWREYRRLAPAL